MLDLNVMLQPQLARGLPEGSPERELASLSLRQLWHRVFDPCPRLLDAFSPEGKSLLEPFLEYASDVGLPLDWRLHVQLLDWMPGYLGTGGPVNSELACELVAASASRWSLSDLTTTLGILIGHPLLPKGLMIGAWKSTGPRERRKVYIARGCETLPSPSRLPRYALLRERTLQLPLEWMKF